VWQKLVSPFVKAGTLTVVGIVQEQHPERAMLYRQWRQLDWPIFVDSLNSLNVPVVPVPTAIDESGIVRYTSISPNRFETDFLTQSYPHISVPEGYNIAKQPDLAELRKLSPQQGVASAWRHLGDALFLSDLPDKETKAIDAYRRAVTLNPMDGRAFFRSGVALRRRFESPLRRPGDGQRAIVQWTHALEANPNQYIWRRRIQQYGPRLDKPYNFYYWVDQARTEIKDRGEVPVTLPIEPAGSELAGPIPTGKISSLFPTIKNIDPSGRITRDKHHLVNLETILTPAASRPGSHVLVRIVFRLADKKAVWNNEAENLYVWLTLPTNVRAIQAQWTYKNPPIPESNERRTVDIELNIPNKMKQAVYELPGYALYYVCEKAGDQCQYLRQDIAVSLNISEMTPSLK